MIADQFRIHPGSVTADTSAMDVSGWDSMTHTLLLMQIEEVFRVRLDEAEGFQAANVGELSKIVDRALSRRTNEQ